MHGIRALLSATVGVLTAVALSGCGGRTPLPDVSGSLMSAVVAASLAGEAGPAAPLLLDSASFARLGMVAGGAALTAVEMRAQMPQPFELVAATDVLDCPRREPCRVRGNATYMTIWEAQRVDGVVELVVNRVFNVQDLHVLTRSVAHRMRLAPEAGGWRLTHRQRLPA
jgi:hypothetical protein